MTNEFYSKTLSEVIRKATSQYKSHRHYKNKQHILSTKQIPEAYAPPFFVWGPWYKVGEIWTPRNRDVKYTISFASITGNITFDIEIAHGYNKEILAKTTGPGSVRVTIPRNIVTALHVRCRSHTLGSAIDVRY